MVVIVKMARCIGRAGCDGTPRSRGLCAACYARHSDRGTLRNYPTMNERLRRLQRTTAIPLTAPASRYSHTYRERNYAERVMLDGYTVHPNNRHGRVSTYIGYGCRGPMCRDAQTWYRDTGEVCVPAARERDCTPRECVDYVDSRYE